MIQSYPWFYPAVFLLNGLLFLAGWRILLNHLQCRPRQPRPWHSAALMIARVMLVMTLCIWCVLVYVSWSSWSVSRVPGQNDPNFFLNWGMGCLGFALASAYAQWLHELVLGRSPLAWKKQKNGRL